MVRLRWVFTASITRDTRIQNQLGKEDSFICGNTKTAHGKSRGSSATTITPRPSKGPQDEDRTLFSCAAHLRCKLSSALYFIRRTVRDAEISPLTEYRHDRRLIAVPSPRRHAACPLLHLRRLGAVPPEQGAARVFPGEWVPEGRAHSERRAGGSSAHRLGTTDESGASRPAFIPRVPFQRINGSEPRGLSRPGRLARSARFSRSALEPRVSGASIPVIGRSGALLARPAFLQTSAAWRRGGLASGLFVLDKDHASGASHLLDWPGRFNPRKRLLELHSRKPQMARLAETRSDRGNGW